MASGCLPRLAKHLSTPGDSKTVSRDITIIANDYKKDVSQLVKVASELNATVYFYTKHESGETAEPIPASWHVEHLPNVGREGHTFVSHILSKPLGDINVFLQSDLDEDGETGECDMKHRIEQSVHMLEDPATSIVCLSHTKDSKLSELWPFNDNPHLQELTKQVGWEGDATITFRGQFCVTKGGVDALKCRYLDLLIDLKTRLETGNNPIEGHCLERYWGIMFAVAQQKQPTSVHIRSLVALHTSYELLNDHTLLMSVPESLKCNLQDVPQAAIEQASWCTEKGLESMDVTELLILYAGTVFFATNLHLGDPMPGKPKLLVIRFRIQHLPDGYAEKALGRHFQYPRLPTLLNQSNPIAGAQTDALTCCKANDLGLKVIKCGTSFE